MAVGFYTHRYMIFAYVCVYIIYIATQGTGKGALKLIPLTA